MTSKELRRHLAAAGCQELRQKGSHLKVQCRQCLTSIPIHKGEDLGRGLLASIERDLAPCLGAGWLRALLNPRR
jgi:predicted RNA binding protein YcfA (HicA-like mRNA interferase family)